MKTIPVGDMEIHLTEHISEVEAGESIMITRSGEPVAALIKPEDFEHLEKLRANGFMKLVSGWDDLEELARIIEESRKGIWQTTRAID